MIKAKPDRDRIRQRSAGNKAKLDQVRRIVREYREQGRPASACMSDVERVVK